MRALALDDRGAVDCAIERPGGPLDVGDRVIGRIGSRVAAMAGAFVVLPGGSADGFLPDTAGGRGLSDGAHVALRVTRGSQGGKGPRLSALAEPAEGPVRLLARGPGAIERLARLHPEAPISVDRPAVAAVLPPGLRARSTVGLGDWRESAVAAWAELAEGMVDLPGGARMTITPTPALTAIDVDAGSATAEKRGKKEAQLALNRALAPAIARQIRLRHLAGAILIDPAGVATHDRQQLAAAFGAALAEDPLSCRFLGFTALGLGEILRPRLYPPVHELLAGSHAQALSALGALCAAWESRAGSTEFILAAPDILGAIASDAAAIEQFRDRTGRSPALHAHSDDSSLHRRWRLVTNL
ncbi:MAG: ribonuclease [Proteobacteria bacterium]|nr:ribonuclease [Pseudomonadota bacterium]